ncbi:MAG TPA: serine/threonine-protein kinase [Phycisphaerae bacterium]|nr:protein kinase [Phycisphaerales bacterium]HNO77516.1 serine/threonine-protein kinase [Phycisphaerae bacterium]
MTSLRVRQRLGKYRIVRRLAEGGFATVYKAHDTIAGINVALKLPHAGLITKDTLEAFRKEVRLTAGFDHPNVLGVKDAGFIDDHFVIVYPLGKETLGDRMGRRMSNKTMISFAEQMLEAVAYAHRKKILHSDLKPENFILFPGGQLRLADFGIAKVAHRTLVASGSGTVGYVAPEQAMGKPSLRSDVFSMGLILYRMFSGQLPEWPFSWPPPGFERVRKCLHPDLISFLRKSLEIDDHKRFADATRMATAFQRIKPRALRGTPSRRRRAKSSVTRANWKTLRTKEFLKEYRSLLEVRGTCSQCKGPVSESMQFCPWCSTKRKIAKEENRFRSNCPRCKRSLKTDWRFCPWCYGAAVNPDAVPRHGDVRYAGRCANAKCEGKDLMPFMQYCPWCRRKVRQPWKIEGANDRCSGCGWGVLRDYWECCPWCGRSIRKR